MAYTIYRTVEICLLFFFCFAFAAVYIAEVVTTMKENEPLPRKQPKPAPRRAIAIDFDGCLCTDCYPQVGTPNWPVIKAALQEKEAGAGLILYTCREGQTLLDAIHACREWGLEFDAVNESLPEWVDYFGSDPRKVGASAYWDDRAVHMAAGEALL